MAYLGHPVKLSDVLCEPDHCLLQQTWAPRDMRGGGTINVDGFGVGWSDGSGIVRHRRDYPMWTDVDFLRAAERIETDAMLAAVRSTSPGMPNSTGACAPFTDGTWLFSLNGRIAGWPDSIADIAAEVEPTRLLRLDTLTDSAFMWTVLRQRMERGCSVDSAVAELVAELAAAAPMSRLNLLLTDGCRIIATTWTHSLWARRDEDAVVLSSEPFGHDGQWWEIPDGHLVVADRDDVTTRPLRTSPPHPAAWSSTFTARAGTGEVTPAGAVRSPARVGEKGDNT